MRGDDQIVVMNPQIPHGGVGEIQLQRLPVIAVVKGNPDTVLLPAYSSPLRTGSSRTVSTGPTSGESGGDRLPGLPPSCVR